MANSAATQQSLAEDMTFRRRVKDALNIVAWQVVEEDPATPEHAARASYARTMLANLDAQAAATSAWIINRANLMGANTTYNFDARATVTDATDAAIQSQISTDFNVMAGIVETPPPAP